MEERVQRGFRESARLLEEVAGAWRSQLPRVAQRSAESLRAGGKILAFGNGGSAADAQHLAAELVNRFRIDRPPLAGLALTTDSSALTAIGNDFGFEEVFQKQVRALARAGDVLVGISTSGRSANVLRALENGRQLGCLCVGLAGREAAALAPLCDFLFLVPSGETPRVQECHIAWVHAFCELLESILFPEAAV